MWWWGRCRLCTRIPHHPTHMQFCCAECQTAGGVDVRIVLIHEVNFWSGKVGANGQQCVAMCANAMTLHTVIFLCKREVTRSNTQDSLNYFSALQRTNTRASRMLIAGYSAPMLSPPTKLRTTDEHFNKVPSTKVKTYSQCKYVIAAKILVTYFQRKSPKSREILLKKSVIFNTIKRNL